MAKNFDLVRKEDHWNKVGILACTSHDESREFKKLRRQLQRKRPIKIELSVKLTVFWLFHVVQNRRSALSLAWDKCFSCNDKE